MIYSELQIHLDLLDQKDRFDFIKKNLPCFNHSSSELFVVCDDGDCHLFNKKGNECDVNEVKAIKNFLDNYKKLKTIKIPNGITSIWNYTFSYCSGLTSVTIPDSMTSIGDRTFYGCSKLASVKIPDGVTSIGNGAFEYCTNLTSVAIGNGVMSIGDWAFDCCNNLEKIIFKNKTINQVKAMENYPFGIKDESIIRCC